MFVNALIIFLLAVGFGYLFGKKIVWLFVLDFIVACILGIMLYSLFSRYGKVDMTTGLWYALLLVGVSFTGNVLGAIWKETTKKKIRPKQ